MDEEGHDHEKDSGNSGAGLRIRHWHDGRDGRCPH
jgi:hypothetical protein